MGKYLTNFKTKEEYEAFRGGDQYVTPNVSFIETAGSVINDSYQVPTSGQGGGSASGSAMEYLDVRGLGIEEKSTSLMVAYMMNVESERIGGKCVIPISAAFAGSLNYGEILGDIKYLSINLNDVVNISGRKMSIKDFITLQTIDDTFFDSIPRITEEEFYAL